MDKINSAGKWAIGGVVVVVIIILAVVYGKGASQAPSGTSATSTPIAQASTTSFASSGIPTPPSPTSPVPSTPSPTPATPTPAPARIVIKFVTPVPNDQWTEGTQYPITWNNEAEVTGEVDLLDAKTKAEVGVILSETGPHQTTYSWDARSYFLARYNPLKKDVDPGTYVIELKFDGNNLPNVISGPITITQ